MERKGAAYKIKARKKTSDGLTWAVRSQPGGTIQASTYDARSPSLYAEQTHWVEHTPRGYSAEYQEHSWSPRRAGAGGEMTTGYQVSSTFKTAHRAQLAAEALGNRVRAGRGEGNYTGEF